MTLFLNLKFENKFTYPVKLGSSWAWRRPRLWLKTHEVNVIASQVPLRGSLIRRHVLLVVRAEINGLKFLLLWPLHLLIFKNGAAASRTVWSPTTVRGWSISATLCSKRERVVCDGCPPPVKPISLLISTTFFFVRPFKPHQYCKKTIN